VYIHIMAKGTIDEEVMRRLAAKQDLANLVVDEYKNIILKGGEENMTKKPYFGLKPGTHEWMEVWKAHPELQNEMLEYQKSFTEKGVLKTEVEVTEENLEDQIENLLTDIENMIKEEEEQKEESSEAPETKEESPAKTKTQKEKKPKAQAPKDEAPEG